MARIENFEDIRAWQRARELVNRVYEISSQGEFEEDYALRNQIRRASGSIMHNIAEGFDSGSDSEFIRFLRYSLRSSSEVQSQLYTALDQGYLKQEDFEAIYNSAREIRKLINSFIGYLVKTRSQRKVSEDGSNYEIHLDDSYALDDESK